MSWFRQYAFGSHASEWLAFAMVIFTLICVVHCRQLERRQLDADRPTVRPHRIPILKTTAT
jgi:hypothetical protein